MPPRFGPYTLHRELGHGAGGRVFEASDARGGRRVALKVFDGDALDAERLARFSREARAARAVSHPAVVALHEDGLIGGRPVLAMELVEGVTLRDVLVSGPLDPRYVLSLARELFAGLAACHAAGVLHRDLKPANLMIQPSGSLKILDLGLAKVLDATALTRPGTLLGTPRYLPPEMITDAAYDARSDVYQAGLIVFECLAGHGVWQAADLASLIAAILNAPLPRLPERIDLSEPERRWWHALLDRALARPPADRFSSAAGVRAHLELYPAPAAPASAAVLTLVGAQLSRRAALGPPADAPSAALEPEPSPPPLPVPSAPRPSRPRPRADRTRRPARVAALALAVTLALGLAVTGLALALRRPPPPPPPAPPARIELEPGPLALTVRWKTAEPQVGVLAVDGTPLSTREPSARTAHALSLTGLVPDRDHLLVIGVPPGAVATRTVRVPSVSDAAWTVFRHLAWINAVNQEVKALDRGANSRNAAAVWQGRVAAWLATPEAVLARRYWSELSALDPADPRLDPVFRWKLIQRVDELADVEEVLDEAFAFRAGLVGAPACPAVKSPPARTRTFLELRFGGGRAPAGAVAVPGPARFSAGRREMVSLDEQPARFELYHPPPLGRPVRPVWLAYRFTGGSRTEKLTVRLGRAADGRAGAIAALIRAGGPGTATAGAVRLDPRLFVEGAQLRLNVDRRSIRLVTPGLELDYLRFVEEEP